MSARTLDLTSTKLSTKSYTINNNASQSVTYAGGCCLVVVGRTGYGNCLALIDTWGGKAKLAGSDSLLNDLSVSGKTVTYTNSSGATMAFMVFGYNLT